jgi:L-ribulose-5-phosphate 4-epimerase
MPPDVPRCADRASLAASLTTLGGTMDRELVEQLLDTTERVLASGAIGGNGHGNLSLRPSGATEMYFTSASSLRGLTADGIARVGLDGTLIEGTLPPLQGAVVDMHLARYRASDDVGCVLHTHSPFATAFAVAQRPIECWIEAMAMFGLADGVPIAGYAPRGSAEALARIEAALLPGVPAVLLANHGVLVFHRTPELAILVGGVVEEAAQAALNASLIGGPVVIPEDLRAAAFQRAMAFAAAGTRKV